MIFWFKRHLFLVMMALAVFFMVLARAFQLGKKSEQYKKTEYALKTATTRLEVENEINQKSDVDVRTDLFNWLRNK
ncbi:hypothetical protein BHOIPH791_12350 [Bartonella henselae]|uniref:Uncharacterized protein n=2 Tax=Bartonella henselae TaxID=38323 RepID=A0A0H3LXP5_BARHE|nr:hypothetical protein [Bartonella henselae]ATP12572.1 hypothetical protein BhenCHDE101_05455 [Bartonella henselae]ETS08184.1 hypothetical protein Q654_01054 [Bartonella henselae JK 50]ETS08732.1 hypothetical protein Q655_01007 [Bartonella henselae JK 51]ETS11284.1 hypothetical protein Q653_00203 [Bartonella henselae JK 42]ETS15289.1 hypothetical protein Q652_00335 [Bartonella henselae JK 41]